ncbi:heterokaryon incompatibility protein-domain-containing protein [Cladorrhinum sp. PSN259]|nr:heterokaryon incompatibility protein-domain-containing protein [Cladorrhinum sp. PSN259]
MSNPSRPPTSSWRPWKDLFTRRAEVVSDECTALLCKKCRKIDFLRTQDFSAFAQCTLPKSQWGRYGVIGFNPRLVCLKPGLNSRIRAITIRTSSLGSLSNTRAAQACIFCALLLDALKEQSEFLDASLTQIDTYFLEWRYTPRHPTDWPWKYSWGADEAFNRHLQVFLSKSTFARLPRMPFFAKKGTVKSIIAPISSDGETLMKARRVQDHVNFQLLRKQLACCEQWHGKLCRATAATSPTERLVSHLVLVDVVDMRLVVPSKPCKYVALSYVWGSHGENSFLTTVNKIEKLKVAGALSQNWDDIPATVQDAISVVQALGEQYLWVDSLCIVQDDISSKHANIDRMADIYAGACFTIVAATGEHAQAGLPGVLQGSRRRRQRRADLGNGLELTVLDDIRFLLERSPWMQRGWTQEWVLSSRSLIFLDGQVVFSCRNATWREDFVAEERPTHNRGLSNVDHSFLSLNFELRNFNLPYYQTKTDLNQNIDEILGSVIARYTRRKLAYDDDILDAIHGVLSEYAKALNSFVLMGTIATMVDWVILLKATRTASRRTQLPSWSWAAWAGVPLQEKRPFRNLTWIRKCCWIVWHHRGSLAESITKLENGRMSGLHCNGHPSTTSTESEVWSTYNFPQFVQWHVLKYGRTVEVTRVDLPEELSCNPAIPLKLGLLQFWTFVTKLPLGVVREVISEVENGTEAVGVVEVVDCDGITCGNICLNSNANPSAMQLGGYEVLLLSEQEHSWGGCAYAKNRKHKSGRDPARKIVEKKLNVLLVSWNGPIAEKVGSGWIYQETLNFLGDQAISPTTHNPSETKPKRGALTATKAWVILFVHAACCISLAVAMALGLDGYEIIIGLWSAVVLWAFARHMMTHKTGSGPRTRATAFRMIRWKLPPGFGSLHDFSGWAISAAVVAILIQAYIGPILTGSVNWDAAFHVSSNAVSVSSVDPTADFSVWYWYNAQGSFDKKAYLRAAAGYANLAWADTSTVDYQGKSTVGNGCRHVVNDMGLPRNSVLVDATLPGDDLTLVGDDPFGYYRGGVTLVYDTKNLRKYPDTTSEPPPANKFSGTMTVALMLARRNYEKDPPCAQLPNTKFGDVRKLPYLLQTARSTGGDENCFLLGKIDFVAGVTKSTRATYLGPRVVEDMAPMKDVVFEPNPWVQEAIWLLPDLLAMLAVSNVSQPPTFNNVDNYVRGIVRQGYLGAWDMLSHSFDTEGPSYDAFRADPRLVASVSLPRAFSWLGASLLMTLSGVLVLGFVLSADDFKPPPQGGMGWDPNHLDGFLGAFAA